MVVFIYFAVWNFAVFAARVFLAEADRGQTRKIETKCIPQRSTQQKQNNTNTVEKEHFALIDYLRIRFEIFTCEKYTVCLKIQTLVIYEQKTSR